MTRRPQGTEFLLGAVCGEVSSVMDVYDPMDRNREDGAFYSDRNCISYADRVNGEFYSDRKCISYADRVNEEFYSDPNVNHSEVDANGCDHCTVVNLAVLGPVCVGTVVICVGLSRCRRDGTCCWRNSNTETAVKDPIVETIETAVKDPTVDPAVNTTVKDPTVKDPIVETIETAVKDPIVETIETAVKDPTVNTTVNTTVKDPTVNTTVKHATVNTTVKDTTVNTTVKDATVNTTVKHATVNTTVKHATVNTTVKDATVNTTVKDTTVNTTVKDPIVETIETAVNTTVKDTTVKDAIVETIETAVNTTVKDIVETIETAVNTTVKDTTVKDAIMETIETAVNTTVKDIVETIETAVNTTVKDTTVKPTVKKPTATVKPTVKPTATVKPTVKPTVEDTTVNPKVNPTVDIHVKYKPHYNTCVFQDAFEHSFTFANKKEEKPKVYYVNPSNADMKLGDGVSGVLNDKWPKLQNEMNNKKLTLQGGKLAKGKAVLTESEDVDVKFVHVNTMEADEDEKKQVSTYRDYMDECLDQVLQDPPSAGLKILVTGCLGAGIAGGSAEKSFYGMIQALDNEINIEKLVVVFTYPSTDSVKELEKYHYANQVDSDSYVLQAALLPIS